MCKSRVPKRRIPRSNVGRVTLNATESRESGLGHKSHGVQRENCSVVQFTHCTIPGNLRGKGLERMET